MLDEWEICFTHNAYVPNSITYLTFKWNVIKCGSENGYQKDTCLEKRITLHIQDMKKQL